MRVSRRQLRSLIEQALVAERSESKGKELASDAIIAVRKVMGIAQGSGDRRVIKIAQRAQDALMELEDAL